MSDDFPKWMMWLTYVALVTIIALCIAVVLMLLAGMAVVMWRDITG